jgi:hypothetical protein
MKGTLTADEGNIKSFQNTVLETQDCEKDHRDGYGRC